MNDEQEEEDASKEPPWFTALVDQKLALITEVATRAGFKSYDVVMSPLKELAKPEPTNEELEKWDQTCDGCDTYVPDGLYSGSASRKVGESTVILAFGVCDECRKDFV